MHLSRRKADSLKIQHHESSAALLRARADAACEEIKRTNDSAERRRLDDLCQRLHQEAASLEQVADALQTKTSPDAQFGTFGTFGPSGNYIGIPHFGSRRTSRA